jgi:hypothetical protein
MRSPVNTPKRKMVRTGSAKDRAGLLISSGVNGRAAHRRSIGGRPIFWTGLASIHPQFTAALKSLHCPVQ